jgi:ABC-2 type transport system permease protein
MPCFYSEYLLSKAIVFTLVAILQFAIMLIIGVYLLPYFGLESLNLGSSPAALIITTASSAIAAIGFGVAIGNIAKTYQQSSVFGAMSVVIMAAIGGIWVPVFLMSDMMQKISLLSPMRWGISAFYDIFLRNAGVVSIIPESAALLLFGILSFIIAVTYNHKYRVDI